MVAPRVPPDHAQMVAATMPFNRRIFVINEESGFETPSETTA
jgi:hypothetical protein